jgi:1-acyl-sn-glycerol-3-phosphate acyltransferase
MRFDFYASLARRRPWLLAAGFIMTLAGAFGLRRLHLEAANAPGPARFAGWTGLAVVVLLYFALGSIEFAGATLLPVAVGFLWALGVSGWLRSPLDPMNSIWAGFSGAAFSVWLASPRLEKWRGRTKRSAATVMPVLILGTTAILGFVFQPRANHALLPSTAANLALTAVCLLAATIIFTPLCVDLLLFKDPPRGAPHWWHPLGTLWVIVHLGGSQLFLYYALRPILKIICPREADDRLRRATRWMARGVVKGLPFGKLEFQNLTTETFSPPCLVISNHQSAVDVMLIVSLPADVRQTAKKRVFDEPMLGIGCKVLGHVMVEPNDPETTLRRCRERLSEGACVHFYPEGTRSPDSFVQRFHRGAFELAVELKQEILPILLCDTNTAMPRDAYWFEPYHSTVRALPRITPRTFDYSLGSLALMRHAEDIMREALEAELAELNTPRVVRSKVARLYRYQGKFVEQFVYWKMKVDPMFAALDGLASREGVILDLGCGYGMATHWLASFTDRRSFLGADYDEDKIRVAQRTAPNHPRITFRAGDILNMEYPACDTILLLDVLHYWSPEKQQAILERARRALRPGGRLLLREGLREDNEAHRRVRRWEQFATRIGHNRTVEGLHFLALGELTDALRRAGFAEWEIKRGAGRDSNTLLVARV